MADADESTNQTESSNAAALNRLMYSPDVPEIPASTRELLENYSKIPAAEVKEHVRKIRDKAWSIHPYPCIGRWRFLDLSIGLHPLYPELLSRMRTGQQHYLDLGCAFAQDIRRLVADGVDSSLCHGSDLRLDFLDLGYELFRDRATLRTEFIAADVFDAESELLARGWRAKFDVVGASSFFHLFGWEEQKAVALRVVGLLRPVRDSLLLGRQIGNVVAGDRPSRDGKVMRFRHNAESWEKLWKEVGSEVGAEFETRVEATLRMNPSERGLLDEGTTDMIFSVRRL